MTTTLQMRIDAKTKKEAQKVFENAGLDLSSGTRLLLTRVAQTGKIGLNDDLQVFMQAGGKDVLRELGPISREDHDYYEALAKK